MYRLTSKLVIYRNIGKDSILFKLADIFQRFSTGQYVKEDLITEIYDQIHNLLDLSTRYGFDKNLWHNYLAFLLAMSENPFTLVSEKVGANEGTVNEFAKGDFAIFKQLFDYDFSAIEKELGIDCFSVVLNYKAIVKSEQIFNKSVPGSGSRGPAGCAAAGRCCLWQCPDAATAGSGCNRCRSGCTAPEYPARVPVNGGNLRKAWDSLPFLIYKASERHSDQVGKTTKVFRYLNKNCTLSGSDG